MHAVPKIMLIPSAGQIHVADYDRCETSWLLVFELPQEAVEHHLDHLDRGSVEGGVLHFPLGCDVRVAECVDRLIAKRRDDFPRFAAVYYGNLSKRDAQALLKSADPADEILSVGHFHPRVAAADTAAA